MYLTWAVMFVSMVFVYLETRLAWELSFSQFHLPNAGISPRCPHSQLHNHCPAHFHLNLNLVSLRVSDGLGQPQTHWSQFVTASTAAPEPQGWHCSCVSHAQQHKGIFCLLFFPIICHPSFSFQYD